MTMPLLAPHIRTGLAFPPVRPTSARIAVPQRRDARRESPDGAGRLTAAPVTDGPDATCHLSTLTLTVHRDRTSAIVTASGALDTYTVAKFRRATQRPDIARTDLAVDLNAVTLIDSSGLHALRVLRDRVQAAGGRLDLVCTRRDLMSALAIAGLKAGSLSPGRHEPRFA